MKVEARPARDNNEDWPLWMVWGAGSNMTSKVAVELGYNWKSGAVFTSRECATKLAKKWNGETE